MTGKLENEYGSVTIDNDVIARHAGMAAVDCFGIVGMAMVNMKDGIVKLLKKDSAAKGVSLQIKDNHLIIEMHIIVAYGVNISTVCTNLVSSVKYKVENFTGMTVDKVNVCVEGVRVID